MVRLIINSRSIKGVDDHVHITALSIMQGSHYIMMMVCSNIYVLLSIHILHGPTIRNFPYQMACIYH